MSLGCRTRHECLISYGLNLWREDVNIIIIVHEIVFFFFNLFLLANKIVYQIFYFGILILCKDIILKAN